MSLPTPNFVLTKDYTYNVKSWNDSRTLPAGTFIRPIELQYIPKETIEHWEDVAKKLGLWKTFDPTDSVYCYTRYGIVPVPRNLLRPV